MGMSEQGYIIFCDESDTRGTYFFNFYGGVLVGATQYDRITKRLNAEKHRFNLFGEVKWAKVSEPYLGKDEELIRCFFEELRDEQARVRIMFRQNAHVAAGLTPAQSDGTYFRLYYQFIKHAFGLANRPASGQPVMLKLYFDEFPDTKEAATQFKGFMLSLKDNPQIRRAGFKIAPEDIAEIRSHDHGLSQ